MNDELEGIWKEAAVASFNLHKSTEENHESRESE
jgi:hypothetical protein